MFENFILEVKSRGRPPTFGFACGGVALSDPYRIEMICVLGWYLRAE